MARVAAQLAGETGGHEAVGEASHHNTVTEIYLPAVAAVMSA